MVREQGCSRIWPEGRYVTVLVAPGQQVAAKQVPMVVGMLGRNQLEVFHLGGPVRSGSVAAQAARSAGQDPDPLSCRRQLPDGTVGARSAYPLTRSGGCLRQSAQGQAEPECKPGLPMPKNRGDLATRPFGPYLVPVQTVRAGTGSRLSDPVPPAGLRRNRCRAIRQRGRPSMKKWQCIVCGFVYDEAAGLPGEGIAAGTRWADITEDWACPDCGVAKADFEMVEL